MLGVVIVSYHSCERTANYIKNELPKLPVDYCVCVIDVQGNEHSQAMIECVLGKEDIYQKTEDNPGYGTGNNLGVKMLLEKHKDMEFLLISNDDVQIPTDANFESLMDYMNKNPQCAVIGPDCVGLDKKSQSPWNGPENFTDAARFPDPFAGESRVCYSVRGCFMVVRTQAFVAVGGFDESFFLFFEEPALSECLVQHGYFTYYPKNRIILTRKASCRRHAHFFPLKVGFFICKI